jgi:hypothetical protein
MAGPVPAISFLMGLFGAGPRGAKKNSTPVKCFTRDFGRRV